MNRINHHTKISFEKTSLISSIFTANLELGEASEQNFRPLGTTTKICLSFLPVLTCFHSRGGGGLPYRKGQGCSSYLSKKGVSVQLRVFSVKSSTVRGFSFVLELVPHILRGENYLSLTH